MRDCEVDLVPGTIYRAWKKEFKVRKEKNSVNVDNFTPIKFHDFEEMSNFKQIYINVFATFFCLYLSYILS